MKLFLSLVFVAAALVSGCAKHDHEKPASGGHVHTAPHGGTLVELGEHAYNLELVREGEAGKLVAYVLDGHAENFIRIAAPSIEVVAQTGGQRRVLTLAATANVATGETVGSTSQFEVQADWLKTIGDFNGEIGVVDIRGTKFGPAAFSLKKGAK